MKSDKASVISSARRTNSLWRWLAGSRSLANERPNSPAFVGLSTGGEFAELVPHHLWCDADGNVLLAVVHEEAHPGSATSEEE